MRIGLIGCFLFLLLPFVQEVSAQNTPPGYLGKRFQIGYGLATSPYTGILSEMRNFRGDKGIPGQGDFFLFTRHELQAQLTLTRKSAIGLHLTTARFGFVTGVYDFSVNFLDTLGQMKSTGLGLSYRLFPFLKRGNIAPIGPFTQVQYTLFRTSLFDPNSQFDKPVSTALMGALGVYFGWTGVLHDRILFDWGIEFNAPFFNSILSPLTVQLDDPGNAGAIAAGVAGHTFINLRLGISGLIF